MLRNLSYTASGHARVMGNAAVQSMRSGTASASNGSRARGRNIQTWGQSRSFSMVRIIRVGTGDNPRTMLCKAHQGLTARGSQRTPLIHSGTSSSRGLCLRSSPSSKDVVTQSGALTRLNGTTRTHAGGFFANSHVASISKQQTRGMANNAIQRFSSNFSVDSSNKVVSSIVAINIAVFATWQYAEENAKRFRDGRLYYFMYRNFTDTAQNLKEGRVWTLVTSAFSHKEWYHIILNTMVLLSFGDPVWRMLGTRKFLAVYLGSAISASLSSISYYAYLEPYLRRIQNKPKSNSIHYSMGASGSLMGMTTAFACVYPMSQYSLFFVINMPAAALIGLFGAPAASILQGT
ncbi:hypothetical protein EC968_006093 [Mortierella alpina]|nr:hypothetical protein EC968_006093 [Mortierella alpina]